MKIKDIEIIQNLLKKKKQALRNGIKAAGKWYYKQIHNDIDTKKSFTPRTGNLQQSITVRFEDDKAVIGTDKEYAPFVEYGTKAHDILPRRAKALSIPASDGFIFVRRVKHPGSKPYPFMFLNLEARVEGATQEFWRVFKESL